MKCPICGKQTLPGAKLCNPCRAALKRAKDDSVWVMPPGQGTAPAERPPDPATLEAQAPTGTRLAGWRGAGIGAAALFVAAGVFATVRMVQVEVPERPVVERAAESVPFVAPASAPAPPQVLDLPKVPTAVAASSHDTPAADAEPHRPMTRPARPRMAVEPTPVAPAAPVEMPAPEPAPAPVVERAPPAKPVDPWQRMAESLARCAGQDVFSRLGCEHRVRAAHCEGNWGRVAQCPAGIANDHGQ